MADTLGARDAASELRQVEEDIQTAMSDMGRYAGGFGRPDRWIEARDRLDYLKARRMYLDEILRAKKRGRNE